MARGTPEERFWLKVQMSPGGCWLWTAALSRGYAQLRVGSRMVAAHRWAYERWRGPIPAGKQLDHIVCETPRCVNPWHTVPATGRQNTLRSSTTTAGANLRKVQCVNGHRFTTKNTRRTAAGHRVCRRCVADNQRRHRAKVAA